MVSLLALSERKVCELSTAYVIFIYELCSPIQVSLTFGQMYAPDEAKGQIYIWSDFGLVKCTPKIRHKTEDQVYIWSDGWLTGQLQLAGWPSDKMSLVYWCKRWRPPKFWLRVRLTVYQMTGWLASYSWLVGWLTGHLTKCQPNPTQDLTLGQVDILSDGLLAGQLQLAGWMAGWPSDKMSLVYWCKRWHPQDLTVRLTSC